MRSGTSRTARPSLHFCNLLFRYGAGGGHELGVRFDVVLSISSFEHDGLGRYGDKIDPDADIQGRFFTIACGQRLFETFAPVTLCLNFTSLVYLSSLCFIAVKRMKQLAVPDGIMLLAVPTGFDQLHWNIHRVYGRARLPLLLSSWKVDGIFGDEFETVTQLQPSHFASPQVLMKVSWI